MKIAEVIKYEGDNKTIIWKHPSEDFNTLSQLIVHQTQEAILFLNGQALDSFGPGRHTLKTQNIPLLTKALNILTDGENPFHCEVYFINKVEQMAIKWGTQNKFIFNEVIENNVIPFEIGARGEMSIKVENARELLLKLVGTESLLTQEQLVDYFFGIVTNQVKANLARTMREQNMSIFTVDEYLVDLSNELKPLIESELSEYGVKVEKFVVVSIKRPEEDPNYIRFKNLKFRNYTDIEEERLEQNKLNIKKQGEVDRMLLESKGMAIKRQQEGYTYQQERGFDIASQAASNEAVGQFSSMGIGLGMATGMAGTIGNQVALMSNNAMSTAGQVFDNSNVCVKCGETLGKDALFCHKCGEKVLKEDNIECPNCKKNILKGTFCMYCGYKFDEKKFCGTCGEELPGDAMFCIKCGNKV